MDKEETFERELERLYHLIKQARDNHKTETAEVFDRFEEAIDSIFAAYSDVVHSLRWPNKYDERKQLRD